MYKVFAFLKRNPNLTHDEYRAGHVGYHCGQSRRLKNIRGYLVNVWANTPLRRELGKLIDDITIDEPPGFLDWWDGFPEVFFDDQESWVDARTVEPNRATADGLVIDPDWSLADSPHLFMPAPDNPQQFQAIHLHVLETVLLPVVRPERKTAKIMQFFKRHRQLDASEWSKRLFDQYLPLAGQLPGLNGLICNLRDADQEAALRGFFADDEWVFKTQATGERREFCSLWDGALELFFEDVQAFGAARAEQPASAALSEMEAAMFERNWYVEVDENLIVNPNRDPAPDFYYR